MNETFRPRSNFAWAGTSFVLITLFAANSFIVNNNMLQTLVELLFCTFLALIAYLVWIKPKLVLGDEVVEIVNPLRTEWVAYADILDLETKWSLAILHTGGKTRVWVAPATGKQRWVADKKFGWYSSGLASAEIRYGGEETMSASLDSVSGQAAYMIREKMKRAH
jgi:hypothetical protein